MIASFVDWLTSHPELDVALATLALAVVTARLARNANKDVEAQWRPLLTPYPRRWDDNSAAEAPLFYTGNNPYDIAFAVKNIGKGAALEVVGWILDETGAQEGTCAPLANPVVAEGEATVILYLDTPRTFSDDVLILRILYEDISSIRHETVAMYGLDDFNRWIIGNVRTRRLGHRRLIARWWNWLAVRWPVRWMRSLRAG